jgi:hypothetical protein
VSRGLVWGWWLALGRKGHYVRDFVTFFRLWNDGELLYWVLVLQTPWVCWN